MKKAAVLLAAAVLVMLAAPAAFATHRQGHGNPGAACEQSQSQAPVKNKHCYPPEQQAQPNSAKKSFEFPQQANDGSITIGMLIVAGLGAFTVMLAARGVRRRLVS
jgi:hypothetical protein